MKLKYSIQLGLIFFTTLIWSQSAFYNSGNLQVHADGQIGFHTNLINDTSFDQNLGTVGFYGTALTAISGAQSPVFYDFEIASDGDVDLEIPIAVNHNANFIFGTIHTPKDNPFISFDYINNATSNGSGNNSKVNGYVSVSNIDNFMVPIGDEDRMSPITYTSSFPGSYIKAAYFFEDPNNPTTFTDTFDTTKVANDIMVISNEEFWVISSPNEGTIMLSWMAESNISSLTDDFTNLFIAGWNRTTLQWENLGNVGVTGDQTSGTITSLPFIADDYTVVSLGAIDTSIGLGNYLLTLNGDGINEYFKVRGIENKPENSLKIFNRWGKIVYQAENYTNDFNGVTNVSGAITDKKGLPPGIYVYVITFKDNDTKHQGFIYLSR